MKRLEQVAALVSAAGLAIVSYWLFFSWMGEDRRPRPAHSAVPAPASALETAAGLHQPLLALGVVEGGDVGADGLDAHRQPPALTEGGDPGQGA